MIQEESKERLKRDKAHVNHFPPHGTFASKYVTGDQDDLKDFLKRIIAIQFPV